VQNGRYGARSLAACSATPLRGTRPEPLASTVTNSLCPETPGPVRSTTRLERRGRGMGQSSMLTTRTRDLEVLTLRRGVVPGTLTMDELTASP
jgi:hypothetical protein